MNKTAGKQEDQSVPTYSKEVPETPEECDRAASTHVDDQKARQERPDPSPNAAPYGGTNLHGTNDPSRFSTPPPKNP